MSEVKNRIADLTPEQKSELLKRLMSNKQDDHSILRPIERTSNNFSLSFAQQRLWFIEQLEGATATYNIPFALRLKGQLHIESLTRAFNKIIERHEILRTHFIVKDGEPIQVIVPNLEITIGYQQINENELQSISTLDAHHVFHLASGPLLRVRILKIDEKDHVLLVTMHHIISDGWSTGVLMKELTTLYNAFSQGNDINLPIVPIQYADYSQWQRDWLDKDRMNKLSEYWRAHLEDISPLLEIPTDRPRPVIQTFRGANHFFDLNEGLVYQLNQLSKDSGATLFMTLLATFYVLLARYSKQFDIAVGTVVANRNRKELENLIGFFVNTLVLRAKFSGQDSFKKLLSIVKDITLGAYAHEDMPFDQLVRALQPDRSMKHSPFFQVMFELNNTPFEEIQLSGLNTTLLNQELSVAKFDLILTLQTSTSGLQAMIEYNTDIFDQSTIEQFATHYVTLLKSVIANPSSSVSQLPILPPEERQSQLTKYNQTDADFPLDKCVHQLLTEQVYRTPHRIAASCDGRSITYLELDQRANQVANALQAQGVDLENKVALHLDRGIEFLIAMIAVLKAGGAFVPLDPNHKDKRAHEIIKQCQPKIVLFSAKYYHEVKALMIEPEKLICIDEVIHADFPKTPPAIKTKPHHLAYIIFTSGSTGKPKGAMLEHRGMVNHLYDKIVDLNITQNDVIAQIAVQTFDVCVWQFICALLVGARTAIFTGDHAWNPKLLLSKIAKEKVTILQSVPSHTKVILDEQESNSTPYAMPTFHTYITNGEALLPEQCVRWFKNNPTVKLVNAYGATECSDDSHHLHMLEAPKIDMPYIPVKQPLPNQQTYILDELLEPTPIGVRGEIYFGGMGVGRGYLDDPERTALSFVPNPFSREPGQRLYKTGDMARYHLDGSIEFLGRSDFQVKIRGFRIEIGEIEAVLAAHSQIESCLVLARKDSRDVNHLYAYMIPKTYPAPSIQEINAYCKALLPEYMIPEAFVIMDEFPLSSNGKVDRKKLPEPIESDRCARSIYIAPRTTLEERIIAVWSEILNNNKIGIQDNFFDLGGHSLLAVELVIKLQQALSIEIPLRHLFEYPTIELLASKVQETLPDITELKSERESITTEITSVRKFPDAEIYDLAPCQIPEWYAYQVDSTSPVYNISFNDLFFKNLNIDIFMSAWQTILNRHDNFRIHFDYQNGKPVQKLSPPITLQRNSFYVDYTDIDVNKIDEIAAKLSFQYSNQAFNFKNGPLFSLKIVAYPNNQYQLLFVVHHIIWDETSTINLFTELAEVYNALLNQRSPILPLLRLNYFDYVAWMNESIKSGRFENHRKYWLDLYKNLPEALDLPTDFPRPALQTYHGDSISSWLSRATARKLRLYLQQQNMTLFMFMMAIIDLYLFRVTGQKDIVIGSPIAGRDHEDFKAILGLFATPMPIRCQLDEKMTFHKLLTHVKEQSLEAYEHHYYPCNLVIEELKHTKDLSRPKLFSVMYGVQNNKTQLYSSTEFDGTERFFKNLYGAEANSARFDLTLVVDQWGSDIAFNCIYNTDIFKETTINRMIASMCHLIDEVIDDDKLSLIQYPLMPRTQMIDMLEHYNQTDSICPDISIHRMFEEQAERTPNNDAVRYGNETLSYEQLNQASNNLANRLLQSGVIPEQSVGIMLRPSTSTIIAMLAILKVGANYVPISPDYPRERIEYIVENANIRYLLTESAFHFDFIDQIIYIDKIKTSSDSNIELQVSSESVAYIIYTSGTTGKPKGIPIKHHGVVNLLISTQAEHHLTTEDSLLFLTPSTFDASILDIFWPLAYGATIVIPPVNTNKNPQMVADLLVKQNISVFQCVPILLEAIIKTRVKTRNLRLVICGGALLTKVLCDAFHETFSSKLFNHYGPTEITVDATRFDTSHHFDGDVVPIGKPITNTKIFILDHYLNPVPIGVVGEIYIASKGLTSGYLGDDEKTKLAFSEKEINGRLYRLYKSGDLGKLAIDGNIYYIGRIDKQVKVRGNRVELEEVDNALLQHAAVKHALVKYLPISETDGQLAAFIEFKNEYNRFNVNQDTYQLFTLSQRPDLLRRVNAAHAEAWPSYFEASDIINNYWSRLYSDFPELQFVLTSQNDELAAVGNTIPIKWNGQVDNLPQGWDAALLQAFNEQAGVNDTLLILAGIVTPEFQGRNLSATLLNAFKTLAHGYGLQRVIVVVRPTDKTENPEISFVDWCSLRREDGQLKDNWLRMHERVGGKILKIAPASQYVEASVSKWQKWTKQTIETSGYYNLAGTLQPATIDIENDVIKYFDPGVWVEHHFTDEGTSQWMPLDKTHLRQYLGEKLPSYMIPDQYCFLPKLPLFDSGKINEKLLIIPAAGEKHVHVVPKTDRQKQLLALWQEILDNREIGITDDFFDLGGQSLKVVQMLSLLAERHNITIGLCHFYRSPTIRGIEEIISKIENGDIKTGSCG